jgi:hypothetical protein
MNQSSVQYSTVLSYVGGMKEIKVNLHRTAGVLADLTIGCVSVTSLPFPLVFAALVQATAEEIHFAVLYEQHKCVWNRLRGGEYPLVTKSRVESSRVESSRLQSRSQRRGRDWLTHNGGRVNAHKPAESSLVQSTPTSLAELRVMKPHVSFLSFVFQYSGGTVDIWR